MEIANRIFFITLAIFNLSACGSIQSSKIMGIPLDTPSGETHVLQELNAGELPYYSATISKGYIDSINDIWLDLKVGSGPTMTVQKNQLDCSQTSSRIRVCSYTLQGAAPDGAVVSSHWHARFRLAGHDTHNKSVALEGNFVPHDLDWGMIIMLSSSSDTPEVVPFVDNRLNLVANKRYVITSIIHNNAGPVVPLMTEARLEFENPTMQPMVISRVNTQGLKPGIQGHAVFEFLAPEVTASTDGTLTMRFVDNNDDSNHGNDVEVLPIRLAP